MEVFEYEEMDTGTKEEMEEEIKAIKDLCDSRLKDIKSNEKYDELAAKAKIIEDYLDQHGLSGATQLILFAISYQLTARGDLNEGNNPIYRIKKNQIKKMTDYLFYLSLLIIVAFAYQLKQSLIS